MIVHRLDGPPDPKLARALAEFEQQFTYPLGPGRSFRISHGEDYPRFFRAIGLAGCFVAERGGQVLGTLGIAIRSLLLPDGGARPAAYLGDLKVLPAARGGLTLVRLAQAARTWAAPKAEAAFSVVMDGTRATPPAYTGRLGIPAFQKLGAIVVYRITVADASEVHEGPFLTSAALGEECYRRWGRGCYAGPAGTPAERSQMQPIWLMHPEGTACGLLEDTRRAKRLIADDGVEMTSAHLSNFAFRTIADGAAVLAIARALAGRQGFPALFVAQRGALGPDTLGALAGGDVVAAPATIYGAELPPGPEWIVNTSEI
jgi:hypothetical protein